MKPGWAQRGVDPVLPMGSCTCHLGRRGRDQRAQTDAHSCSPESSERPRGHKARTRPGTLPRLVWPQPGTPGVSGKLLTANFSAAFAPKAIPDFVGVTLHTAHSSTPAVGAA
jgi:hypothetical protein